MTGWHVLLILIGIAVALIGAHEVASCRCEHQEDRRKC